MVLVADTSPLNYLTQIGAVSLLPVLYGTVHIPDVVLAELSDHEAPASVQDWVSMPPRWLFVQHVSVSPIADDPIDVGERAAIQLALSLGATRILMGDATARVVAEAEKLRVTGTICVLEAASDQGLIEFKPAFQSLLRTNFRISARLRNPILAKHSQQRT